jgi:hypothetical protein
MREEKVKVAFFQGEIAVLAHGHCTVSKPENRRRTSGEPAKA